VTAHPGPEPVPLTAATISVTELNHATATVLSRVEQGEHLTVTHRGQVIAQLVPAAPHPLAPLVGARLLQPPTRLFGFPATKRPPPPLPPSWRMR